MKKSHSPWLVLSVLCLGQAVALMDTTVVNVAIPAMSHRLGADLDQILWVVNGYVLTYAVLLVTFGRIGDLYGQKATFLAGLGVFTISSALCGLAQSPTQLIIARLLQGVGGAMLTPQSLAVVSKVFPAEKRGAALGVWGAFAGASAAIGPSLGGLIVSSFGWRWVFYINVPIGLAAIVLGAIVVPDLRGEQRRKLDLLGTAVLTAGLALLVFGFIEGPPHRWGTLWGPVSVPVVLVLGALVLVLFAVLEGRRQGRDPLVPFEIIRQRNFALMAVVVVALPCGLGAMLLLTSIHLQSAVGMSPVAAGLTIAAAPLVSVAFAPYAGRCIDRFGGKYVMFAGFALFAVGIGYLALAARGDSTWLGMLPGLVIVGIGMGVVFSPPAAIAMHDIEPSMSGAASGLFNMMRLCGSVLGGALVGALLQARLAVSLTDAAQSAAAVLPAPYRQPFVDAFATAASPDLAAARLDTTGALAGAPRSLLDSARGAAVREGVTDAVRFSYLLPVAVLFAGALGTLAVRGHTKRARSTVPELAADSPGRS
ncbi:MFS transporter [Amycolatopsis sp. CA-230715]|uniref:MFS transporter n=1 Tax=Amycolatopsis sp. CA-230715 TaxID=2745196 RepID=UPI001C01268F|nr:MFS transporter [Amycolatopsis sp. CA-230715]QWF84038.1 Riboflavin transporter RibZ [Amycolatopsis sp. CA-230715]